MRKQLTSAQHALVAFLKARGGYARLCGEYVWVADVVASAKLADALYDAVLR